MQVLGISALGVTLVMLGIWLVVTRQIMADESFPELVHGALKVSSRGMQIAWILGLLFALGVGGPTIARRDYSTLPVVVSQPDFWGLSDVLGTPREADWRPNNGKGSAVRFGPFGRATYSWTLRSGGTVSYSVIELRLPLYFLVALLFYWLGVARRQSEVESEKRVVLP